VKEKPEKKEKRTKQGAVRIYTPKGIGKSSSRNAPGRLSMTDNTETSSSNMSDREPSRSDRRLCCCRS